MERGSFWTGGRGSRGSMRLGSRARRGSAARRGSIVSTEPKEENKMSCEFDIGRGGAADGTKPNRISACFVLSAVS